MKSRILAALLVSALFVAGSAEAQTNTRTTAKVVAPATNPVPTVPSGPAVDSTRAYDSQALRYEARWGSADIRRGASGTVIGRVGWFRGFDVEQLVSASPRAVTEARVFRSENFHGTLAGSVGVVTFVTGLILSSNSSNNAASPILIIAGAGGIAWGAQHLQLGYAALTRAFWWYNRDLTR